MLWQVSLGVIIMLESISLLHGLGLGVAYAMQKAESSCILRLVECLTHPMQRSVVLKTQP